jgi:WD40 repeat protein
MKRSMRLAAVVALALAALGVQSCGDKESLVVVGLTTSTPNTTLKTVVIGVGGVSRSFDIPDAGLSDSPTLFGVYVTATGSNIFVGATAMDASGKNCFSGLTMVDIPSKGSRADATIELRVAKSCTTPSGMAGEGGPGSGGQGGSTGAAGDTGTAGVGGTTGSAGMTGTAGAGGTVQTVPPLGTKKCAEYFHISALTCSASSLNASTLVWDVAFSPDGSLLATAGDDGNVKIWKMNGSVPTPEGHNLPTTLAAYIAFSPDGKWLAVGSETGDFELYDAKTFQVVRMLNGHVDDIEGLAFTSDSQSLWSIDHSGVLTRHDVAAGSSAAVSLTTGGTGFTMALSPTMTSTVQWLAVGFDDGTGAIANVAPSMPPTTSITVSHDTFGVYGMSFSPDGNTLAAGGNDGIVGFWTVPPPAGGASTGTTITLPDSTNTPEAVKAVRYSPDGKSIAIGAGDPAGEWKVAIYDVATHAQVTTIPTYTPLSIAWSPSGTIIAAGEDTCGKILICSDN